MAVAFLVQTGASMIHAEETNVNPTAALRAKYVELRGKLDSNPFQKPLYLESSEASGKLTGSMFALLSHPFPTVQAALKEPEHWCDILILHLNTKYCRASAQGPGTVLKVNIGKRSDQPIEQSFRVEFAYRVIDAGPEHLAVVLDAGKGPLGTRNYRILLEAVPLQDGQTFLHLAYSYGYGTGAKLAILAYLGTAGRNKVGFTVTGRSDDGQVVYIDGLRGVIERNTMRYFLAIEAYLGALSVPPAAQLEKRLMDWYTSVERYPRQLHEIGEQDYLTMKRREYQRQQAEP
ncbi:MAG: hypothetical protein H7X76_03485 [Prolixibacteraceae bacterium]|nr:hypothetical protein [Burkholderiales bacterium]